MGWKEKYKQDKRAKISVWVTSENKELFKKIAVEDNTSTTELLREMVKYLIEQYAEELKVSA